MKPEEIFLNPVRMRIVQHLADKKSLTAGRLSELMQDIPRTTLYRHINILAKENVITVVKEHKIRGTYEREYSLNTVAVNEFAASTPAEKQAMSFLMGLTAEFKTYFNMPHADAIKDRIFLSQNILLFTDSEFEDFIQELYAVISKYVSNSANSNRRERKISIISSPVLKEETKYEQ